jgi:hypothetical protein
MTEASARRDRTLMKVPILFRRISPSALFVAKDKSREPPGKQHVLRSFPIVTAGIVTVECDSGCALPERSAGLVEVAEPIAS